MRIVILGCNGLLGSCLFLEFKKSRQHEILGTQRNKSMLGMLGAGAYLLDAANRMQLEAFFKKTVPDCVINCIGITKHNQNSIDIRSLYKINCDFPKYLAKATQKIGSRLIHFSTDCVFSGHRGFYKESDSPDAADHYGKSKARGEIIDSDHVLTLRTSMVGHELPGARHGLLEWFLAVGNECQGYTNAYFSGLTTNEIFNFLFSVVIPRADLHGLYHLAGNRISKFDLLKQIAGVYNKKTIIHPDASLKVDRSLSSAKLARETGYVVPSWPEMFRKMKNFQQSSNCAGWRKNSI